MHVPAMAYLKYEVTAGVHVRMYVCVCSASARVCVCVCEWEREAAEGEREFVTSKISEEQSGPLPSGAIHEPINRPRVCATVCARARTMAPTGLYEHV